MTRVIRAYAPDRDTVRPDILYRLLLTCAVERHHLARRGTRPDFVGYLHKHLLRHRRLPFLIVLLAGDTISMDEHFQDVRTTARQRPPVLARPTKSIRMGATPAGADFLHLFRRFAPAIQCFLACLPCHRRDCFLVILSRLKNKSIREVTELFLLQPVTAS